MALMECQSRADEQGRELTRHGTALFPVACYHDDLSKETVPWHWHDELELNLVSEGACVMAVDGEQTTLQRGEAALINAGAPHACWSARGVCRLHAIVFHPRFIGGSAESVFMQSYVLPLIENQSWKLLRFGKKTKADRLATARIEAAWTACRDEPRGYEFLMREEISRLLLDASERLPKMAQPVSLKAERNERRLKQMLEYIRANLDGELTVDRIAASASVSASECMRRFKEGIGVTPIRYVRQLRLIKAAELLADPDVRINEAAEMCGFHEMSYFARVFQEQYGATPSAYRKAL